MGDGEFWPLTESKPMSRLQQNSAQLITSARGPPKPNLAQIHPLGAFWAYGWNITFLCLFYLYLFFWDSRTGQTGWRIFRRDSSLDLKSRKDVPFGVIKLKFNIKPLFIPPNRQILAQTHWTWVFFAWKCLTMGALKSKLPLIIIVPP